MCRVVLPGHGRITTGSIETNFSEIVDAADNSSVDEQESLIGILRRRIAEQNRKRLIREVADARTEHESGQSRPGAVAEIMDEIRHEP